MNEWQRRLLGLVKARVGLSDERLIVAPNVTVFVHERMRQLGLADEDALVRQLIVSDLDWQAFLSSLLNGQTCFFRDREQLDAAISVLAERQREVSRRLYLWSAGCSTGEEPYSLAVLAERAGLEVEIWATDLNVAALSHARRASYGAWSLRHLQDDLSFGFEGDEEGCRVRPELALKVRFARHNLLRDPTFRSPLDDGGWDLILCRNVLIYYTPDDAADVARRLAAALAPGGSLGLGASEGVAGLSAGIPAEQRFGRVFYRREQGGQGGANARAASLSTPAPPSASTSQELALPAWRPSSPASASQELALPAEEQRGFFALERKVTALAEEGHFDEAVRLLEELVANGPDDVMAMLALGHVELRRHAFERALAMYARVQAHDPLLAEGHLFEGVAQRKRGEHACARQAFQRVLFLDPACWPASYLLTGTLERLYKDAEAARERRRALQLLEEHGAKATSSSLSLGVALLPDPEECLVRLRGMHRSAPR